MKPRAASDLTLQVDAVASETGHLWIWVWVLGGVTKTGKELDAEPRAQAFPTKERAQAAAKKLGPKVWPVQALFPCGKVIRWAK